MNNKVLTSSHPLPEPPQPPHPPHTTTLLPPPLRFLSLPDLTPPLALDPPPQTILDPLPFNISSALHNRRSHVHGDQAGDTLLGKKRALDEGRRGRTGSQTSGQADGNKRAGETAGHNICWGENDGAGYEVGEGRPFRAPEKRGQDIAGVPETPNMKDGGKRDAAKVMARLSTACQYAS